MSSLYQVYRHRKFAEGGDLNTTIGGLMSSLPGPLGIAGTVMSTVSGIADAIDPANKYGKQSLATNVLKNSALGPLGAVKGIMDYNKQVKQEKRLKFGEDTAMQQEQLKRYSAMATSDPSLHQGNQGVNYYAEGGSLGTKSLYSEYLKKSTRGGSLQRLSSDTVEVKGPSHEAGGVQLPGGNEVEGKETIKGDYVLSSRLGFAQLHKPIAKAIGQLEKKAPTAATMNSLRNLRKKEEALVLIQEATKAKMNHGI